MDRAIGFVGGVVIVAVLLPTITTFAQSLLPALLMLLVLLVGFRWLVSWL
jgi:hypothetical protein